jgi:hypothetical protein
MRIVDVDCNSNLVNMFQSVSNYFVLKFNKKVNFSRMANFLTDIFNVTQSWINTTQKYITNILSVFLKKFSALIHFCMTLTLLFRY